MKRIALISLFFILFLSSLASVSAISISPSKVSLAFSPNMEVEREVCVKLGYPGTASISAKGTLAPYIVFSEEKIIFNSAEERRCFTYRASLPSELTPGVNYAYIIAGETAEENIEEGAGMMAIARVAHTFEIIVPYPGKYLTASLRADDAKAGDQIEFIISIRNEGKETISQVGAKIELIDQNNEGLGSLLTTKVTDLEPRKDAELKALWAPSARDVGTYRAVATIDYDGSTTITEASFKLGELLFNILDIISSSIEKDKIGEIGVLVESVWISPINDVYAEVRTAGKTVKSESVTLNPWEKKTIPVFFSTQDLEIGEYPATAIIYYAGKTIEKEFVITVFEDKTMFYFMTGSSVVLLIIIAALIIFFMRHKKFKERMQHAMYIPK